MNLARPPRIVASTCKRRNNCWSGSNDSCSFETFSRKASMEINAESHFHILMVPKICTQLKEGKRSYPHQKQLSSCTDLRTDHILWTCMIGILSTTRIILKFSNISWIYSVKYIMKIHKIHFHVHLQTINSGLT